MNAKEALTPSGVPIAYDKVQTGDVIEARRRDGHPYLVKGAASTKGYGNLYLDGYGSVGSALYDFFLVYRAPVPEPESTGAILRDSGEDLWVKQGEGFWWIITEYGRPAAIEWSVLVEQYGPVEVLFDGVPG